MNLSQYWVEINGKWGADNFGQFTIDGMPLPPGSYSGAISLPPGNVAANYQQTHDFSISRARFPLSHLHLSVDGIVSKYGFTTRAQQAMTIQISTQPALT